MMHKVGSFIRRKKFEFMVMLTAEMSIIRIMKKYKRDIHAKDLQEIIEYCELFPEEFKMNKKGEELCKTVLSKFILPVPTKEEFELMELIDDFSTENKIIIIRKDEQGIEWQYTKIENLENTNDLYKEYIGIVY